MPDDKLTEVAKRQATLANRLSPTIVSDAKPETEWLVQARADINRDPRLKELFQRSLGEGQPKQWLIDNLAVRLNAEWGGGEFFHALEVATYLADEHEQLGEGIRLVSTETGKVTALVTSDDIYQPAPVPRESGDMAIPLPRIDPALEKTLVTWVFEQHREERIVATLAERANQTALLKEEGDPRLRPATRAGRSEIVRSMTDFSPTALLERLGGTSAAFLQRFDILTEEPADLALDALVGPLEGYVAARSTMNIADQTTINLSHSREQTLRGALPQAWARDIARRLSLHAQENAEGELPGITPAAMAGKSFWVTPPELMGDLFRLRPKGLKSVTLMPVDGSKLIGFRDGSSKVGVIVLPESFGAESHELFDRWEAVANLEYKLWYDPMEVFCVQMPKLEYQAHTVRP